MTRPGIRDGWGQRCIKHCRAAAGGEAGSSDAFNFSAGLETAITEIKEVKLAEGTEGEMVAEGCFRFSEWPLR
jgi:hypothetical protein